MTESVFYFFIFLKLGNNSPGFIAELSFGKSADGEKFRGM